MGSDTFTWLQEWYLGQCNGDWEHEFGIKIGTLDNPGWTVDIDLTGTPLEGASYKAAKVERTENDWLFCEVAGGKFKAACGPRNLGEAVEAFQTWAGEQGFERRKAQRLGA